MFTSVIPNLLVDGIPQAIAASSATKAYFVNLMSQPGETTGFRASDHLAVVLDHCGRSASLRNKKLRNLIDVCVINTRPIGGKVLERYSARAARPVENDIANLEAMGVRILGQDLLRMASRRPQDGSTYKIRHDSAALGAVAVESAREARYEREAGYEREARLRKRRGSKKSARET